MNKVKFKLLFCLSTVLGQFSLCSYTSSSSITLEWHAYTKAIKRSDNSDAGGLGHSFVKITNNSSSSINVGYYTLPSDQYVTIGLWTSDAAGGGSSSSKNASIALVDDSSNFKQGVLYNEERYVYTKVAEMEDDVYAKMTLSTSDLSTLSIILKNANSKYNVITYNCATFTTEIWNKLNSTSYWTGWFRKPTNVKDDITYNYTYYNGNDSLTYTSNIYFYNSDTGGLESV